MPDTDATRGLLILVVGPSGVGKDTLIDAARQALAGDPTVVFPRREITRSADAGGEDHVPVSVETFRARRAAGAYALSWEAHGLGYGIPAAIAEDRAAGRRVVVNVSRGVLDDARQRLGPVRILSLRVPAPVLRARLVARAREDHDEIERRVARSDAFLVDGPDVITVVNDGPLEVAAARFVDAVRAPALPLAESPNGNISDAKT